MDDVLRIFRPNEVISKKSSLVLVAGFTAAVLFAWTTLKSPVFPSPLEILTSFGPLWNMQGLGAELITSMKYNLIGIWMSLIISLTLAYLQVLPVVRPITSFVTKLRFIGGVAGVSLIFQVVLGGGYKLRLLLIIFSMTPFLTTTLSNIMDQIPRDKLNHARTLRMSPWRAVLEVYIFGTVYEVLEAFRQNACIAWMMITTVEGLTRSVGGMGTILLNENKHMELAAVFGIQLLFMTVGFLQDIGIGVVRNILCLYGRLKLVGR